MIDPQQAINANRTRARPWLAPVVVEGALLASASALVYFRFPEYTKHLWAVLIVTAGLGVLVVDLGHAILARKRAHRFARSFDVSEQIRRKSAEEPDDIDRELAAEEILEDFITVGRQYLRGDNPGEAVEHFQRAIDLDPHQSRLYNFLGMALGRLDRHDDAIQAYHKAIAIDYDYSVAHFNLALAFEQARRDPEALEEWHKYVEIGEVIGERDDMLDRAHDRIRELQGRLDA